LLLNLFKRRVAGICEFKWLSDKILSVLHLNCHAYFCCSTMHRYHKAGVATCSSLHSINTPADKDEYE